MKNLLEFPSARPQAEEASLEGLAVGHALIAVWQTPWMAEVCIREADGMEYRCRIALQLESNTWLELTTHRLTPLDPPPSGQDPPMGWQRVRPAEHRWDRAGIGSPLGQTVAALAVSPEGFFYLVLESGLLWVDLENGGICRFEPLNATQPETRTRLSELTRYPTGESLIP